MLKLQVIPLQP